MLFADEIKKLRQIQQQKDDEIADEIAEELAQKERGKGVTF